MGQNCSKIYTYLGETKSTESWRLIKQIRQNQKKKTNDKWETYFKTLVTEDKTEFKINNGNEHKTVMTTPLRLTMKEVKK